MEGVPGYSRVYVRVAGPSPDKRTPLGLATALFWSILGPFQPFKGTLPRMVGKLWTIGA